MEEQILIEAMDKCLTEEYSIDEIIDVLGLVQLIVV
jgi:hypothetical protein